MGVDVYHGDGPIKWPEVAAAGHSFAILKASEGLDGTDAALAANIAGARAAGMIIGVYHFIHLSMDPVGQAKHFLEYARQCGFNAETDFAVLDLEDRAFAEEHGAAAVVAHAAAFVDAVDAEIGKRTTIYVDLDFANEYVGDSFAGHPLWIAVYGGVIRMPAGWTDWRLWQYSATGTVPGIENGGQTDMNHFNGDEAAMRNWAATGVLNV